jgi:hypothetical protein
MSRRDWRYIAVRLEGDGTATTIHPELPLGSVEIEDVLSGPNGLTGTLSPEIPSLVDQHGLPILDEWSTAIFAEYQGEIFGGGILADCDFTGPKWNINTTGFIGYWKDMPYTGPGQFYVKTDTLDIVRAIGAHVQGQDHGNIGLEFDGQKSGVKVGSSLTAPEYDPNGPSDGLTLESQAYKLAWHADFDLLSNIDDLAEQTPFDYHERHWWDGDDIRHRLDFGVPNLGRKRNDLRFVIGENLFVVPSFTRVGDDYANEVYMLGAGEGAKMIRGHATTPRDRLRRVAVVTDSSVRRTARANRMAQRELAWRKSLGDITSLTIRDHPHAPIGSIDTGDEIYVEGTAGWVTFNAWCRVLTRTIHPDSPGAMDVTLVRSDRIAS